MDVGGAITQIVAGGEHTCALLTTEDVRCWGQNEFGQLGYGNTEIIGNNEVPSSVPVVNVGGTVTRLVAGQEHTCALLTTGDVRCWGAGFNGRLGYGGGHIRIGDDEAPAFAGDVPVR